VSVIRLTDILLYHTLLRQLEFEFQINEILFSLFNEFSKIHFKHGPLVQNFLAPQLQHGLNGRESTVNRALYGSIYPG
jgi:hypothetical protein